MSGPDDMELKDTKNNARKKLEVQMESAMPCKSGKYLREYILKGA